MSDNDGEPPPSPTYAGFQRWFKLSVDDLPLIRPPKHHMLAHVTGGLTKLYEVVTEDKGSRTDGASETDNKDSKDGKNSDSADKDSGNQSQTGANSSDIVDKNESNVNSKQDDEGGGNKCNKVESKISNEEDDEEEEEEETTPYTDEEGEFAPDASMPLLARRYRHVKVLARGQSALIIKAQDTFAKDKPVAIKVLHRVYKPIGSQEADILLELHHSDPWLHVPFARLQNQFLYGPHYCLVFEYLSPTPLYTHYDKHNIRGAKSLDHIRNLTVKLLTVMGFLHKQNVIHADLKPENILLKDEEDMSSIMVVDFGNALRNTDEELSLYYSDFELQTLLYRAPEVIFGMKFSLEVDMWSLGCLLAECYIGEPLFMGKTKQDILCKITKLLGPFPKDFAEGECAEEYEEFIGRPLSRYQRIENLRKRLNDCKDINFLLLVDKMLTYLPERRITPFEAACQPFVAAVSPFLYLSSSKSKGILRYPTILLDMATYPYLPEPAEDENDSDTFVYCRNRLVSYSKTGKKPMSVTPPLSRNRLSPVINNKEINLGSDDEQPPSPEKVVETLEPKNNTEVKIPSEEAKTPTSTDIVEEEKIKENEEEEITDKTKENKEEEKMETEEIDKEKEAEPEEKEKTESETEQENISTENEKNSNSEDKQDNEADKENEATEKNAKVKPANNNNSCKTKTTPLPSDDDGDEIKVTDSITKSRPTQIPGKVSALQKIQNKSATGKPGGAVTRTDVKETLKSMGLRCEDFTISVYSREQAHAILRKQGVEVTNHTHSQYKNHPPQRKYPPRGAGVMGYPPRRQNLNSSNRRPPVPQPPPPPHEDEDDDDCVILDPPDAPVPKPIVRQPPPQPRLPQQFQLMGTTVQVSRGAKRYMRGMHQPPAKRHMGGYYQQRRPQFQNHQGYYDDEEEEEDDEQESSVQDTLKRLKNYNISITCRRGGSRQSHSSHRQSHPAQRMAHPPHRHHKGPHSTNLESEDDDDDVANYLECQIGEDEEEYLRSLDNEDDEELMDISQYPEADVSVEEIAEEGVENQDDMAEVENQDSDDLNHKKSVDDKEVEEDDDKNKPPLDNKETTDSKDEKEKDKSPSPVNSIEDKEEEEKEDNPPSTEETNDQTSESKKDTEDATKDEQKAEKESTDPISKEAPTSTSLEEDIDKVDSLPDEDDLDEELENQLLEGGGTSEPDDEDEILDEDL